jgi:hypothetical protein
MAVAGGCGWWLWRVAVAVALAGGWWLVAASKRCRA